MRRSTVVKIFVGSLIGAAPSLVLLIVAGVLAIRSDAFVDNARANPPQGTR